MAFVAPIIGVLAAHAATIGAVAGLSGAAISAFGAIKQGQAAKASANYNAAVDEQNATLAQRNADLERDKLTTINNQQSLDDRRLGQQKAAAIGDLNAKAGAGGVDPGFGSAADLVGDTSTGYRIDQGILLSNADTQRKDVNNDAYNYDTQAAGYKSDAVLKKAQGKDAAQAGWLSAGASLLSGASTVAGKWKPAATSFGARGSSNVQA